MPAWIISAGLTAFGAARQAKQQKRAEAMMLEAEAKAAQRGQQRRAQYMSRMAPGYRMRELALGTTGKYAKLRTVASENAARQQRTMDLLSRGHSLGGPEGQAHTVGSGDIATYLQSESYIAQRTEEATTAFTNYAAGMAQGEAAITGETDAGLTNLASQRVEYQANKQDPWGAAALGYATSMPGKFSEGGGDPAGGGGEGPAGGGGGGGGLGGGGDPRMPGAAGLLAASKEAFWDPDTGFWSKGAASVIGNGSNQNQLWLERERKHPTGMPAHSEGMDDWASQLLGGPLGIKR